MVFYIYITFTIYSYINEKNRIKWNFRIQFFNRYLDTLAIILAV